MKKIALGCFTFIIAIFLALIIFFGFNELTKGYKVMISYDLNPSMTVEDIFISEEKIAIVGSNRDETHRHNIAVIHTSLDRGNTWETQKFNLSDKDPRFFFRDNRILLLNYEQNDSIATLYLNQDGETFLQRLGLQKISEREFPILDKKNVFPITIFTNPTDLSLETTPTQSCVFDSKNDTNFIIGYTKRNEGQIYWLNIGKYDVRRVKIALYNNEIWILARYYPNHVSPGKLTLFQKKDDKISIIKEFDDETSEMYGGMDSPKDILVNDKLIVFITDGPYWYGTDRKSVV